jgi:ABC-type sugar transport system substrate-binding protein
LKHVGDDGLVHVIGINGTISDFASIQREKGLERAVADRANEAVLDQVISADWDQKLACNRCRILQRRYPEASVIWTASDHMAIGVIEAMAALKRVPGVDVVIGGVDAMPDALLRIDEGSLHATVGGHFMEGGWVAVLLHDFLAGSEYVQTDYKSPMKLVTKENLDRYRAAVDHSTWERFDFRQLSRVHHPEMGEYPFGVDVIAEVAIADESEETESEHDDISTESNRNRP